MLCTRNIGEVLTPGSIIRPVIDAEYAALIMKQLYGMEVNTCHTDVNIADFQSLCDELRSQLQWNQSQSLLRVRNLKKKILFLYKNVKVCSHVMKFSATPIFDPILLCIRE